MQRIPRWFSHYHLKGFRLAHQYWGTHTDQRGSKLHERACGLGMRQWILRNVRGGSLDAWSRPWASFILAFLITWHQKALQTNLVWSTHNQCFQWVNLTRSSAGIEPNSSESIFWWSINALRCDLAWYSVRTCLLARWFVYGVCALVCFLLLVW